MPVPLSSLAMERKLRVLLLGVPQLGKTTTAVCTSPRPVRVILCEMDNALDEPVRQGASSYTDVERCLSNDRPYEQMTTALVQAKEDAKAGKIKTLVIDPLSDFADRLLAQSHRLNLTQNGEEDGRRAYPHYTKRLIHCLELAFTIPAHIIVVGHYEDDSSELGGKKVGEGIVPLLPGKARKTVGRKFNDILWFDLDKDDPSKRVFITRPLGAWGPGCRSLSSQYAMVGADFNAYIALTEKSGKPQGGVKNGAAARPPMTKPSVKPQPQAIKR
jgi:AAA domain